MDTDLLTILPKFTTIIDRELLSKLIFNLCVAKVSKVVNASNKSSQT